MANRFPLIFNSGAGQIQELAASDNLDLTSSNLVNAGILFTSSGSQTAPSISIGNGTTYPPGLYSPGTDQLAVATNGVERVEFGTAEVVFNDGGENYDFRVEGDTNANLLFVDASTDRVGIGTTNVNDRLEVYGVVRSAFGADTTNTVQGAYRFNNPAYPNQFAAIYGYTKAAATDQIELAFLTSGTTAIPAERMRLTQTGLGIGNTNPGSRLEIGGDASYDAKVTFNRVPVQASNDGVIGELFFQNNADSVALIAVKRQSAADDAYIQFATQQTTGGLSEKCRITSDGKLLVGTTSDANGGQVEAKTATVVSGNPAYDKKAFIAQIPYATANITSSLLSGFDGNIHGVDLGYRYNSTGYDLCFATNSTTTGSPTEAMRIDSQRNVTIGTTTTNIGTGFASNTNRLLVGNATGVSGGIGALGFTSALSGTVSFVVSNNGAVRVTIYSTANSASARIGHYIIVGLNKGAGNDPVVQSTETNSPNWTLSYSNSSGNTLVTVTAPASESYFQGMRVIVEPLGS